MRDANRIRRGVAQLVERAVVLVPAVAAAGRRRQREGLQQRQRGHDRPRFRPPRRRRRLPVRRRPRARSTRAAPPRRARAGDRRRRRAHARSRSARFGPASRAGCSRASTRRARPAPPRRHSDLLPESRRARHPRAAPAGTSASSCPSIRSSHEDRRAVVVAGRGQRARPRARRIAMASEAANASCSTSCLGVRERALLVGVANGHRAPELVEQIGVTVLGGRPPSRTARDRRSVAKNGADVRAATPAGTSSVTGQPALGQCLAHRVGRDRVRGGADREVRDRADRPARVRARRRRRAGSAPRRRRDRTRRARDASTRGGAPVGGGTRPPPRRARPRPPRAPTDIRSRGAGRPGRRHAGGDRPGAAGRSGACRPGRRRTRRARPARARAPATRAGTRAPPRRPRPPLHAVPSLHHGLERCAQSVGQVVDDAEEVALEAADLIGPPSAAVTAMTTRPDPTRTTSPGCRSRGALAATTACFHARQAQSRLM